MKNKNQFEVGDRVIATGYPFEHSVGRIWANRLDGTYEVLIRGFSKSCAFYEGNLELALDKVAKCPDYLK